MTFEEIEKTADEMHCVLLPEGEGRYTLYTGEPTHNHSVCWIFPNYFNGKGSVSSTYDFPQVDGFENFTKEEMISRIVFIRTMNKNRYIEKRLEKMQTDF